MKKLQKHLNAVCRAVMCVDVAVHKCDEELRACAKLAMEKHMEKRQHLRGRPTRHRWNSHQSPEARKMS